MAVFLQSGANALDVAKAVQGARWPSWRKRFPEGIELRRSRSTPRASSRRRSARWSRRILEAAVLVLLVVFVFLQSWRATLIPMIAVPVSLIGTFAGLWLFGFSINTLTLFAMVLAIGIVVDDAIVVLENVERLMREQRDVAARGGDRGDARGVRARSSRIVLVLVRGVRSGGLPRRHRRAALQAVRGDGGDRRGAVRLRRADAHAGAVRAAAASRQHHGVEAVPALQPGLRRGSPAVPRSASTWRCVAGCWRCWRSSACSACWRCCSRAFPGASCRPRIRAT